LGGRFRVEFRSIASMWGTIPGAGSAGFRRESVKSRKLKE
jgi:hypothetical protein